METGYQPKGSPEKRPSKKYAEVARREVVPTGGHFSESHVDRVQKRKKERDVDQVAKEMDAKMKKRLLEQEEKMDELYLKTKDESNTMMEEMLGRFQTQMMENNKRREEKMLKTMSGMIEGVMRKFGEMQSELGAVRVLVEGKGVQLGVREEPKTMSRTRAGTKPIQRGKNISKASPRTGSPSRR